MIKKIVLTAGIAALIGAGMFALGRISVDISSPQSTPIYSLAQGPMGMFGPGSGYMYGFDMAASVPGEEVIGVIQDFLDRLGNPDLAIARIREFNFAYQAEIIERSTGQHAFGLMFGRSSWQVSPEAGPNVFWNTKYGSMIAEVGGGYGMVGRLLAQDPISEVMPITETAARAIAVEAVRELDLDLNVDENVNVFYGFYEYHLTRNGDLVGELDVNGYSGQAWFKDWGEPQRGVQNLLSN